MSFLELAKNRFSERFFSDKQIEKEKLDMILEARRIIPRCMKRKNLEFILYG